VSERMRRTGPRDTAPELELRRELHQRGLRFFVDRRVPASGARRRIDIVFPRRHVAVLVDGCFWHGCPEHASWPKANAESWKAKIEANRARDRDTNERLRAAGWIVIRIWEHEDPVKAADRIERVVRREAPQARKTSSSASSNEVR
jgi:DNA mismatch endonuclease (patch repair protein)